MTLPEYRAMLATPAPRFDDPGWLFEPKWDGVRGILYWDRHVVSLRSRTGAQLAAKYPELGAVDLGRPCVLDGEIVVFDPGGRTSFERLQQRAGLGGKAMEEHPVTFVAFDVLHLEVPLIDRPLEDRLALLEGLDLPASVLRFPTASGSGDLWRLVEERDLEGVVAKRRGSPYRPGTRSTDWRKTVNIHTARAVVGGFTPGEGGRAETLGSLVLGMWDGDRLRWVGSVGSGFADADLAAIRRALDQQVGKMPFHPEPGLPDATWVVPSLVAAVEYRNWTGAGRLRHPRFRGFTDDLVDAVTWEAEGHS